MCHTQKLGLGENNIGDASLNALAKAVESGALASLKELELHGDQIGDDGLKALAEACASGALPKCTDIGLGGNPASVEAGAGSA